MTTLKKIGLRCPNCQLHFTSATADDSDPGGRRRTDFQVCVDGLQPLPYAVHLCERCGFAGPRDWFSPNGQVSADVRRHVWNELAPRVRRDGMPPSEKFEFAAKVAEWDGASTRDVAELWLRAAWCCVNEGDVEAERYYRRHAVWRFEECFEDYTTDRAERPALAYLIGELWRRIGDTACANAWFERVPFEITNEEEQGWYGVWADRQRNDPLEWFV